MIEFSSVNLKFEGMQFYLKSALLQVIARESAKYFRPTIVNVQAVRTFLITWYINPF